MVTELAHTKDLLSQAEASKVVNRAQEDIDLIEENTKTITKLREEAGYVRFVQRKPQQNYF